MPKLHDFESRVSRLGRPRLHHDDPQAWPPEDPEAHWAASAKAPLWLRRGAIALGVCLLVAPFAACALTMF